MCVECILKFTPVIEYELILFDNGSTDGTLDYFKSVKHPRKKIIRVTKNVGSISNHVYNHYSGRYLAYIMGDVYVTQNWLKNLLACIKSDQAIGMVVPVASNVSLQGANITFDTLDEMQAKAANHNISNPKLWHERLTLFPAVGLYKREALELGGVGDSGFFHYLADNDMSFRIRRAGFKLVLCEDTFVHHDHIYANVSEKDNERNGRSMEAGRKDFKSKYFGVEAWDDVNNFEPLMMSLVSPQEHLGSQGLEILGVDVFCGTPILEVKNKLREALVYAARLSAFSTDPKYWLDLKTICTGDVVVDRIEHIKEHFADEQFDYIVMGIPINSYQNPLELLHYLLKHVKSDGHLLLKLRNTSDVLSLFKTLGANINVKTNNVYQLSMDELIAQMKSAGFVPKKIASENWPLDEKNLQFLRNAITATGFNPDPIEVLARAVVRDYVIDITME
jgi:glycosyltransferase involved in cell wall biosynthesis